MQARLCAALAVAAVAVTAATKADDVRGTRSEELREKAHDIRITMAATHAALRVRRSFFNGGPRHDQAVVYIDLPKGAVATGLATLGAQGGHPIWFRGDLMEAEAAAKKYQELTGLGGYYPKDPALLSWRRQDLLALQVFPCAPSSTKWVEYTLEIPTRYESGRYFVELPRLGTEALAAAATVFPANSGDQLFVNGTPAAPGSTFPLESPEPLRLELRSRAAPQVDGELGVLEFAENRVLTRFRVAAAPKLSTTPRGARIVIVLDASHSLEPGARLGAIAASRAYLSHFPDARVEIASFDRQVHPLHHRLVPVAQALADLKTLQLIPRNGSHLDRALVYADTLLSQEPVGAPKRILVLTDALTRSALSTETLAFAVENSHALVHIGVLSQGTDHLQPDDEHPWSRVTRPTGGLVWNTSVSATGDPMEQAGVFEEWVRPKTLEHFQMSPSDEDSPLVGQRLAEGASREFLAVLAKSTLTGEVKGELWTEPVHLTFSRDETAAKRWAALVFGTELLHQLSEEEMMVLARQGGAVSPVTSYLAIEPGVRPSTEGLEQGEGSGEGIGLGAIGAVGYGAGSNSSFDPRKHLEDLVAKQLIRCGGANRFIMVDIETTRHEIVDVPRVELLGTADEAITHCVREGIWSFALPTAFSAERASWTVRG